MTKPLAVVTGGAGFVGSHMVDLLIAHGFRVHVVDNLVGGRKSNLAQHDGDESVRVFEVDIRSLQVGSSHADEVFNGARYVFHFAGIGDIVPSIERPSEYMSVNVLGTVQVLECARHAGVNKLIYSASSSCFGLADVPTREDHKIQPEYPYALSKYQGEQAVFHWGRVYRLPVNSIRIFNAYGPRVRTSGAYGAVFGVFLRQKLAGQAFTVVGDGNQTRDFVHVRDVAGAFFAAAETDRVGEAYNVGTGRPRSINELVALLGGEVTYIPVRPGEPDCTCADISKITSQLGWRPKVAFPEGVAEMLENIDYWRDAPLWTPHSIAKATETWFRYLGER